MYTVQSVLLKKSKYTKDEAVAWIKENEYDSSKMDTTDEYYRFRQVSPSTLSNGEYKTVSLGSAGYLIIYYSKQKFRLEKATDGVHKFVGIFADGQRVPFGSAGMTDYTLSKDPVRRRLYLLRHRSRENWNDPRTAGALSRHLLWGDTTSLDKNLELFKQRFNL